MTLPLRRAPEDAPSRNPVFRANLRNGQTAEFSGVVPSGTTGVTVAWRGVTLAFPGPKGFDSVRWEIEEREDGGEVVADALLCFAGEVRLGVLVFRGTGMTSISLKRVGRRRFAGREKE